jgi:UDP-N-acetylmuramate: L-alanyl-gamma-D-glutamyl-meso-diaminopimelate ligase
MATKEDFPFGEGMLSGRRSKTLLHLRQLRMEKLNTDPPALKPPAKAHLMGIGGTGMAALAGMFRERGYHVTGSDQGVYPPMSDFLRELGIEPMSGYRAENLSHKPDLVVVGNVIRRSNPEAIALEKSGIPMISMPSALIHYFAKDKKRIVVSGTHGKTTLSSMIAWILSYLGLDPGFMIGGLPKNFENNYRLGSGPHFVIEGDEYDTAYFDKKPKFLHYAPDIGVITSCEFDHGDIYDSLETISRQFREFAQLIPNDGALVACSDTPATRRIIGSASAPTVTYGFGSEAEWTAKYALNGSNRMPAQAFRKGIKVAEKDLPIVGKHNVLNALAAVAVAALIGIEPAKAFGALSNFKGVKRRQDILGEPRGILFIDDFAHHPTAVKETCEAIKARYPQRRLVAVFEPRTNTSRTALFQKEYVDAFLSADVVVIREPRDVDKIDPENRFSAEKLASDLTNCGKKAHAFADTDGILDFLKKCLRKPDVALIMSNGSFDNLNARLLDVFGGRENEGSKAL